MTLIQITKMEIKIITKEQAVRLGLTGSGGMEFGLIATGKIGEKKAEKVEIVNIKTGEKKVLFDKGKKFKFDSWSKKGIVQKVEKNV